jgi:hypothetical protein
MPDGPARGPRLPRHTPVSDLIPVLAIEETHFVTVAGRYGRVLACDGVNLAIQGAEAAELTVGRFGDALAYLPPDAGLQLLALNRPLRGDDWVPTHLAQYVPPPGLADYTRALGVAYARELVGRHVTDLRFYAVLSLPGPAGPGGALGRGFRRRRILGRGREAHGRAVTALDQASAALGRALAELDVRATPLGRQGTIDLLWECANPEWGRDVAAPRAEAPPAETRTLRERLGQSRLVRRREWIRLDGGYEQTLALRALPEATVAGWLRGLATAGVPLRLALHVTPLQKAQERRALTRTLRQRHGVLRGQEAQSQLPDLEQEEAYREGRELLEAMAAGDLRTFRFAALVATRATTAEGLRVAAATVAKALGDAGGTSIDRCLGWQDRAWQATLPLGVNPAGLSYRVIGPNLADSLPFLQGRAGTPGGRLIGFSSPGHEAVTLDLFHAALDNYNMVCLGGSGSGKTMFAQSFALKHLAWPGRVLVFDHSTGHWDDLVAAVPGAMVHQVGLDSGFRVDPWQLAPGEAAPDRDKIDYLLDLHAILLAEPGQGLPLPERALLEGACRAVYREHAASSAAGGPADAPGPWERHLHAHLRRVAAAEDEPDRRKLLGALADRLAPWIGEGTYAGLLDGPTTIRRDAPLEVFNFKGFSRRPDLLAAVMLPLLEHVWTTIGRRSALPVLLILDEGWSWLEHPASARFVGETARTGRHHGVATLNMSQSVRDYEGALGRVVLDNASVQLLLRQSEENRRRVGVVFGLTADEEAEVARLRTVKGQKAGAYLVARSGAASGAVDLYVTPEEYWLFTSHQPDRELRDLLIVRHRGRGEKTPAAVWAAVRALAALTPEEREALRPGRHGGDAADAGGGRAALRPLTGTR